MEWIIIGNDNDNDNDIYILPILVVLEDGLSFQVVQILISIPQRETLSERLIYWEENWGCYQPRDIQNI